MGFSEVLRLLDGTHPVEEAVDAYHEARRVAEHERRGHLAALGVAPDEDCPAARVYHAESAISRDWIPRLTAEESHAHAMNLAYKRYPEASRVRLPSSTRTGGRGVGEVIRARRSVHEFADRPLDLERLGALLRDGCGVTRSGPLPLRAAPSAGALYPVETYVMAFRVDGLEAGLYHYAPLDHELEKVSDTAERSQVIGDILAPGLADVTPPVILAMTAVLPRVEAKYGERGYRFSLLEAGHVAQNLYLLSGELELAASCIGGFCDGELNRLLGVDGTSEVATYLFLTGWPVGGGPGEAPA